MRSPETGSSRRGVPRVLVSGLAAVLLVLAVPSARADQVVYFLKGKAIIVKSVERGPKFTVLELEGGGRVGVPTEQIERIEAYQEATATAQAPVVPIPQGLGMLAAVQAVAPGSPTAAAALDQPPVPSGTLPVLPVERGVRGRIDPSTSNLAGLRSLNLGTERPGPAFMASRPGQPGQGGPGMGGPGRPLGNGMGGRQGRVRPGARARGVGPQAGTPGPEAQAAPATQPASPAAPSAAVTQGPPAQNQASPSQSQASPPAPNSEPPSADSDESDADAYASGDDGEPADNASP